MGKLPLMAAVASAMWAPPVSAEGGGGNVIPPNPKPHLLSWNSASDLTAVPQTKSTASVVITIATMKIGVIFTGTIGATTEAEPVVT
jgi:hypothetical protein